VANMLRLRQLMEDVVANGKVEGHELEVIRRELYADGKIDRREADFLAEMHKRVQRVTPAFEQFFYQAIKDHILADGKIDPEEVTWLRQLLYADGRIDDREKKFLHELRGEARQTCPEFAALCKECLGER
jgi:hypothetical protein